MTTKIYYTGSPTRTEHVCMWGDGWGARPDPTWTPHALPSRHVCMSTILTLVNQLCASIGRDSEGGQWAIIFQLT